MDNFTKIIRVGQIQDGNRKQSVFCKIKYEDKNLSITGVVSPTANGNCGGGCGQIQDELKNIIEIAPNWNRYKINKLRKIWDEWHLNDLNACCEHQRKNWDLYKTIIIDGKEEKANWTYPKDHKDGILTKPCEVCHYKYGSAWLFRAVPIDVLEWLRGLPNTDRKPAWI